MVSEKREETRKSSPSRGSYSLTAASISRNSKLSPEVYVHPRLFASAVLASSTTRREFSLPFPSASPTSKRSGGIFAAAAPTPRCQPLAHDLNATHAPRHRLSFHLRRHSTSSPPSQHKHSQYTQLTTPPPEQQLWLPPPSRPAFGHLKGSPRTTAPTASDRVISQIASIRKNKDTLNSKPPPSLGSNSGS